ncbi:MAG: prolyl oligopeptidase family serine peptidase [Propionibacteriaceae bacterium]|nr:prolyl oligopeptidase family serine peptidase [Propionibacteriaceae bacterium]
MPDLPHGQWLSPVSAADLARGRVRLSEGFLDDKDIYWLQSDPADKGRTTVIRRGPDATSSDITPEWDVRTSIHEYGGTAAGVRNGWLCFFDRTTKQVWAGQPHSGFGFNPITPAGPLLFGGFVFLNDHEVVCVRESHDPGLAEPRDALVILDLTTGNPGAGRVIAEGADFYFGPAVSNTGRIAWMEYDHPSMPWGTTRIVVLEPDGSFQIVANAPGVSAVYPQWAPDGSLVFLSDESGYWNFYRWNQGHTIRMNNHPYDFCLPAWVLSQPPYALLSSDGELSIGCSWWQDGLSHLGRVNPDGTLSETAVYGSSTVAPATNGSRSVVSLVTATDALRLAVLDWSTGDLTDLAAESNFVMPADMVSVPELIRWQSDTGDEVAGWYYPPRNAGREDHGPAPVIIVAHGGPTTYSPAAYSLVNSFFTTRGIGIADVNYSGSAALGRSYRERLNGNWGILDVRDCADAATYLVRSGRADPARLAIMGSSAGGFTALGALSSTTVFSAGISLYGVADLEALARDTTKFESHYTDTLVAPYPEGRDVYVDRSPITHVHQISCPLLILQGTLDPVVPPDQATMMYEAVRARGLDAELHLYDGEGHGFRSAPTIEDAYTRILAFLGRVWGFSPDPRAGC